MGICLGLAGRQLLDQLIPRDEKIPSQTTAIEASLGELALLFVEHPEHRPESCKSLLCRRLLLCQGTTWWCEPTLSVNGTRRGIRTLSYHVDAVPANSLADDYT